MNKGDVRKSKEWHEFRDYMRSQYNSDYITGYPLRKGWNLHHLDLNEDNYDKFDEVNFACLNKQPHEFIHWLYKYYVNDHDIINRLKDFMDKMENINVDIH